MKVLVTGSNGFLGSIFCFQAMAQGSRVLGTFLNSQFSIKGCETEFLDITDREACFKITRAFEPDAIIHCARYSVGVGQCERDRRTTFEVNTLGTRNMARCAEKLKAFFVYISTDWIFNGKLSTDDKYNEHDDPCPLNYYGFTKWAGEREVARTRTKWLIIRPANIYGVHGLFLQSPRNEKQRVLERSSWAHKMVAKLRQGEKIWLPDAMYQSPILADNLAEITLRLLKENSTGIYHVAGRDSISRYHFLRTAAEMLGLDEGLVAKGTLKRLEKDWGIPPGLTGILPNNVSLDIKKVEKTLGIRMSTLREGLSRMRDCIEKK